MADAALYPRTGRGADPRRDARQRSRSNYMEANSIIQRLEQRYDANVLRTLMF